MQDCCQRILDGMERSAIESLSQTPTEFQGLQWGLQSLVVDRRKAVAEVANLGARLQFSLIPEGSLGDEISFRNSSQRFCG